MHAKLHNTTAQFKQILLVPDLNEDVYEGMYEVKNGVVRYTFTIH